MDIDPHEHQSLYFAFLQDPTQRTIPLQDADFDDDDNSDNVLREFIARIDIGRMLQYDTRLSMENQEFNAYVPQDLRQHVMRAFRFLPDFPHRHLFKFAANKLCLWEGQITDEYRFGYEVTMAQVLSLAYLYHHMLTVTDGRMYQFCMEHMDVEICLVIAKYMNVALGQAFPLLFQDNSIRIE